MICSIGFEKLIVGPALVKILKIINWRYSYYTHWDQYDYSNQKADGHVSYASIFLIMRFFEINVWRAACYFTRSIYYKTISKPCELYSVTLHIINISSSNKTNIKCYKITNKCMHCPDWSIANWHRSLLQFDWKTFYSNYSNFILFGQYCLVSCLLSHFPPNLCAQRYVNIYSIKRLSEHLTHIWHIFLGGICELSYFINDKYVI